MHLNKLALSCFRNMDMVKIEPSKHFNILCGNNGHGKTNLLEAIYLLGSSRSFRTSRMSDLIKHGEKKSQIISEVVVNGSISQISLTVEQAGRRLEIDGKRISKVSDLHSRFNSVVFSPDDTAMVKQGPETRRRYLDRVVYTGDISYLHCWQNYYRVLKQRNYLLKNNDKTGLDIWTNKLAKFGAEIVVRRQRFVSLLNVLLKNYYSSISGSSELVDIVYEPAGVTEDDISGIISNLLELFIRNIRNDDRYGTTTVGPHRDDLSLYLNGRSLKAFGSQGQQKSFILALKMAEMENLMTIFGESPLLLLDDMSSELDSLRNENLMSFLSKGDIQVFITTVEPLAALERTLDCTVFRLENGNLHLEI